MRLFIVFILSCVLASCQDKKTKKNTQAPKTSVHTSTTSEPVSKNKPSSFLLTDSNVMEFLVDYDKTHTETTVRITTDFGTIDILLFEVSSLIN